MPTRPTQLSVITRAMPAVMIALAGSTDALAAGPFGASFNLSSLNGTAGFVMNGIDIVDRSGRSVSSAGDVNGDGFDDLIIGASSASPGGAYGAGESYVVFGGVGVGGGGSINLSSLNGTNGFVLNGIDANDGSGRSVSSAGDVNGDGFDDLIIGASSASPGGANGAGESYVVFGGVGVGAGGSVNLSSLNGTNGFVLNGIDVNDHSGISVSSAGDVNGDGIGDLIIGAYVADPGGASAAGESYIVFGGVGVGASGSLNLSTLNGTNGFIVNGIDVGDASGRFVSSAGDVNGDDVGDLIIAAPYADPGGASAAGESYVVFGKITAVVGPFAATLNLSTLNGSNGFIVNGIDASDFSGWSAASAGDVNGDGFDDLIIGAYLADPGGASNAGESYIVFGSAGVGAGGSLNLSSLNGTNGFILNGIDASDQSGMSVSSAGDLNDDGVGDLIIGAPFAGPGGASNAGESYVVFGSVGVGAGGSLNLSTLNGTNGFVLNGIDAFDQSGMSVSSAGDVNGDGVGDLIIGAYLADPGGVFNAGEAYVVFGRPSNVWASPTGGAFDTAANWLGAAVPGGGRVIIDTVFGVTVTGPAGGLFIDSLTLGAGAGRTTLNLVPGSYMEIEDALSISASAGLGGSGVVVADAGFSSAGLISPTDMVIGASAGLTTTGSIRMETFAPSPTPKALTVFGPFTNSAGGQIVIRGAAVIDAGNGLANDGTISIGFADATIYGSVDNNAFASISGGSEVILADDAANSGTIELTTDSSLLIFGTLTGDGISGPGGGASGPVYIEGGIIPAFALQTGIAAFGGNVALGSAGITTIEIAGTAPGAGHDQIDAAGLLSIAGALHVNIINAYAPQPGDAYKVLDFAAASGSFSSVVLDAILTNAGADTSTLLIDGTIRIPAPSCSGDINGDGFTNAADFVTLAGNFGASVTPNTSGDLNGDGVVNAADFVILAGAFGCAP